MIEIKNVHKSFGRKHVLKGVNFEVPKGQITALIGVNGVGKTTLLQHIMRLTPMDQGEILIDGRKMKSDLFEKVCFIPDSPVMLPEMTIRDSMNFMADYYDCWNEERALDILRFFNLKETDRLSDLSKGNVAKANMLFGFALDTDYILMDEPFSGVDIFTREEITNIFSSYLVKDRGVLITTHEINEIEKTVDRVVIIEEGQIVTTFDVEDMRAEKGKSIVDVLSDLHHRGDTLAEFDQHLVDPKAKSPFPMENFLDDDGFEASAETDDASPFEQSLEKSKQETMKGEKK
ncbi:ABC transporter ATP-binding protein [Allofustis seminis]|uniref:ABC transporter ATP-binding protein n=1 Tax=Allofustis seminis TaxID=166939 RepID=UPI00035D499C|nr:ABC transporter ATP-binding protein [Allofustis seminis]